MIGAAVIEDRPIGAYCLLRQIFQPDIRQRKLVCRSLGTVAHHCAQFFLHAVIVAITVAPIASPLGIVADPARTDGAVSSRHPHQNHSLAIDILFCNIGLKQEVGTCLLLIVESVPEIALHRIGIGESCRTHRAVRFFCCPQHDQPSISIGKGGIRLPEALGRAGRLPLS